MSAINKNFGLSSSLEEEVKVKKQGIVSILGYSDCEKTKSAAAASLRRALSADMSSRKWLSQHGFNSPLKKIASSEEFPVFYEEEEDKEHPGQLEIWNSIQSNKENEKLPGHFDIWSSIVSKCNKDNDNDGVNVNVPYVHPLVKRSASLLSEKSLQICTESLGSETGSDGFSSYPASETEDEQEELEKEPVKFEISEDSAFPAEKYTKKAAPRSFPPPLPSLSRGDGASLQMRPRRDNGRLVLEAVSIPPQNNFHAERQDGRLVLTFINDEQEETKSSEEKNNEVGMFRVDMDEEEDGTEEEEEEEKEEVEIPIRQSDLGGGVMNVHRLALMMNKSVLLTNRNPTWPKKFENEEEMDEAVLEQIGPLTRSLPPRAPLGRMISMTPSATAKVAAALPAGSLNAYEYYWKAKPMVPASPLAQNPTIEKNMKASEKQELLVLRGNKRGNYLLPLSSKGCKEPRRSVLFWEPYCIATS